MENSKVLIVDDEAIALATLRNVVEEICQVICCSDSSQAVILAKSKQPDLIILDIEMSQLNGLDICRILKNDEATAQIPVIFVTANSTHQSEYQALEIGGIDYICKPIHREVCQRRIVNHLERVKYYQAFIHSQKKLEREKEHLKITLNSIGDAVISTDASGHITFMNPIAQEMTGWTQKQAIGQSIDRIMNLKQAENQKSMRNPIYMAIEEKRRVAMALNAQLHSASGKIYRIEDTASPILLHGELLGAVVVFHDVSEAIAMAAKMNHIANHDPLTDLPNRILLHDRISQGIQSTQLHNELLALILIDADHFLYLNDSAGHYTGDLVIQKMAQRLAKHAAAPATLARIGGDEFVIVMPNLSELTEVDDLANALLTAFNQPFVIDNKEHKLSVSIGISLYPDDAKDEETLMRHADVAMFRAKEQGRNQHCYFSKELERKLVNRHSIENILRHAINKQTLELHYQPQYDLISGRITGAEALVRLPHQGQYLSPVKFIALAEENGMIHELGRLVLASACLMAKQLKEQNQQMRISVNIAARQFSQQRFFSETMAIINQTGADPNYLELELTESALMHDHEETRLLLEKFSNLGLSIAIDDFGTGYSSLSYLKYFNVNILKIDQSFVFDMLNDKQSLSIVKAIISMAHAMELNLIAEGIESRKHAEKLIELGCATGQGYYFNKPLAAQQFLALLKP